MKNLSILTLFLVLLVTSAMRFAGAQQEETSPESESQNPAEPAEETEVTEHNDEALAIVRKARSELFKHSSVQADLTQRASLGAYHFKSTGNYASGEGFRTRIEYYVELAEMTGQFLEVCDGQILHTRRQITPKAATAANTLAPQIELARRDIQKILKETQKYLDLEEPQADEAMLAAEIGIGGLPAILASLERSYFFEAIRTEEEDGQEIVTVQGRWNPSRQSEIIQGLGSMAQQVSVFLPDRIRIAFRTDTYFPIRFQYLKMIDADQKIYRPLLTVELSNIKLNEQLSPRLFSYVAPVGMEERDETTMFIETIRQAAQPEEAAATDSAAVNDDSVPNE